MTTVGIICAAAGAWIILAAVVSVPIGRSMRDKPAPAPDDDTRWLPFLPPVPPPAIADDWLDVLPAECLSRDELDRRFFRLVGGAR